MANIADFTSTLFDSANKISDTYNDYISKEAKLSTQNKEILLQQDINNKLAEIKQSSDFTSWNTDVNNFFEKIKGEMSNPESKYYCKNNLQGDMLNSILEQNRLGVTEKVNQMSIQRQMEKDIVDVQNSKTALAQMYSGQNYIDRANELDKGLYETGRISIEQYQEQKDLNFVKGYQDLRLKTFEGSLSDGLAAGRSFDEIWNDMEKAMPEMKATDISGLEKAYDKDALNSSIKKVCQQNYNAALNDIQQKNAETLSGVVQAMRQQNTAEGKVSQARRGQNYMNSMTGLKLSETDRLKYSALFELNLGDVSGADGSGGGSGSGSGSKPTNSFEAYIKAAPGEAIQSVINGDVPSYYDSVGVMSNYLQNEWYSGSYKENYEKSYDEKDQDWNTLYRAKSSPETMTQAVLEQLVEKYPAVNNLVKNNFKGLMDDMQKNPKQYGGASVGELSQFLFDTIMSGGRETTDEDIIATFQKHINDCYVEKTKYVELDKNNKLKKTYDAGKVSDIAQAARLAQDKDYVFTYGENEIWASGTKEALEAEGGIVDVLKNAVAGTLDIPDSEHGQINYYYKPDEAGNDMTSTPIITYKNKAYEVIPSEDDKSFSLKEIHTGEVIQGKVKNGKEERAQAKAEAKAAEDAASKKVADLKREREQNLEEAIKANTTEPTAVKGSRKFEENEWNWTYTTEGKKEKLNITASAMDSDAKKVKKGKLSEADFKTKYGIDYSEWIEAGSESDRFTLILQS